MSDAKVLNANTEESRAPRSSDERWDDRWLDAPNASPIRSNLTVRSAFRESVTLPALWYRRTSLFFSTTIGPMTLLSFALTIAILAAGLSMAQSTQHRQTSLGVLINNTEPMSAAAQDLYTSLSLADTTATTGFVQAGVEDQSIREKYQRAVQRASSAATQSASGIGGNENRELELIAIVQAQLPVYTGLVETARTNNRSGNPVGVAYMSEASALMRTSILPSAAELLDLTTKRMNSQQKELTSPNWIPISGLIAALLMILLAQKWLAHKTRRRLNKGFLTATVFMSIALLWVVTSNALTWHAGTRGYEEAAAPLNSLANARVLAQQARTSETLALVRREASANTIEGFASTTVKINTALDQYSNTKLSKDEDNKRAVEGVQAALEKWGVAHEQLAQALNVGDYDTAVKIAFQTKTANPNSEKNSAMDSYDAVDSGLATLMSDTRGTLRSYIHDGLSATRLLSTVVMLLSVLSVVSIWLGIRPRLQEYL